jgi:hypothetical protein
MERHITRNYRPIDPVFWPERVKMPARRSFPPSVFPVAFPLFFIKNDNKWEHMSAMKVKTIA